MAFSSYFWLNNFDIPKSEIFILQSLSRKMLLGFKSECNISCECKKDKVAAIPYRIISF